jgi:GH25 family lysozyme M1 (1,4-beta-N-acetylmuramidase)
MNTVEWIDVSYVQGYPNYLQLKADGIYGAIARVNEGTIEDGSLAWNWPRITAAGLVRGGYDFAYTANTATFEANEFLSYLREVGGWTANDILILDIEQNAGNLSAAALQQWVLTWCQTVMSATGIRPWIYSYLSFISQYLQNSALTAYPLWVAEPSATSWPAAPAPWSAIIAWQYGEGALNGVSGSVDLDQVDLPSPIPVYTDDMRQIIFSATVVNQGPSSNAPGGVVDCVSDGTWFRWIETPSVLADILGNVGPVFNSGPVAVWGTLGQPVADLSCFGRPQDQITATMLGLPFGPTEAGTALSTTEAAQLADADAKAADADAEIAQVDADIKALPAPATPGEVLAVEGRVEGVEADVLAGDAAIENVINARGKTKP